jgi:F0F1-type ATP synthase membrane subunit c/vacuolar-type H+-ATPase subunit K
MIDKSMKLIKLLIIILGLFFFNNYFTGSNIQAQVESSGIGISIPFDMEVSQGQVVCSTTKGFSLCNVGYQPSMYGVLVDNPAAAFESQEPGTRLVVSSGAVIVKVTAINGPIEKGNFVTSSTKPGIAQLANKSGFVLGSALQEFKPDDSNQEGEVLIALDIHPASGLAGPRSDLLQVLRQGLEYPILEPLSSFRYVLAALIVVIAFSVGLVYFGTVSRAGVEAIGRNPRAGKLIQMSILLHVMVTIVIFFIGLAIAYLILIL